MANEPDDGPTLYFYNVTFYPSTHINIPRCGEIQATGTIAHTTRIRTHEDYLAAIDTIRSNSKSPVPSNYTCVINSLSRL